MTEFTFWMNYFFNEARIHYTIWTDFKTLGMKLADFKCLQKKNWLSYSKQLRITHYKAFKQNCSLMRGKWKQCASKITSKY